MAAIKHSIPYDALNIIVIDDNEEDYLILRELINDCFGDTVKTSHFWDPSDPDIADQRKKQLLSQQREFEQLLVDVGCAAWRINLSDGSLLGYSGATESLLKVNLQNHLGEDFFSLAGFNSSRKSVSDLNNRLKQGETVNTRILFKTPEGEAIWLQIRAKPVKGNTVKGIFLDVTKEYFMEERQRHFQDAFDQTEDAIFITDADIRGSGPNLIYANAAMLKMSGRSFEELVEETPADLRAENNIDPARQRLRQALLDGECYVGEFLNHSKSGKAFLAKLSLNPIRNEAGEITHFLGIKHDVTKKREMEKEISDHRERLQLVIEHAPFPVILYADDGDILMMSRSWSRCANHLKEVQNVLDDSLIQTLLTDSDLQKKSWNQILRMLFINQGSFNGEYSILDAHGEERVWRFNSARVGTDTKKRQLMVSMAVDVTELKDALVRAESANVAKSDFLAIMSHELRTPLNPILGFSEMLAEEIVNKDHQKMLKMIHTSAGNLLRMIEDILDFTQMEAGKLKIESLPFSLSELVEDCIGMLEPSFRQKDLSLKTDWRQCPELFRKRILLGDDGRIRQVVMNLLNNARKFTSVGGVTLRIRAAAKGLQSVDVFFDVVDTGIGMNTSELQHIFEAFYQIDGSIRREQGGVGMGLAICKEFATRMNGEISVKSSRENGSVFSFRLPLNLSEPLTDEEAFMLESEETLPNDDFQIKNNGHKQNGRASNQDTLISSAPARKSIKSQKNKKTSGKMILLVEDDPRPGEGRSSNPHCCRHRECSRESPT